MENRWAKDMEGGSKIYAHVETIKDQGSDRPSSYSGYFIEEDAAGNRTAYTFDFPNEYDPDADPSSYIKQVNDVPSFKEG